MKGGVLVDEHESATAEIAGEGIDDGEGKADGDGGIDGVAAFLQDLDAGVGGEVVDGDDHGVRGAHGLVVGEHGGGGGIDAGKAQSARKGARGRRARERGRETAVRRRRFFFIGVESRAMGRIVRQSGERGRMGEGAGAVSSSRLGPGGLD